MGRNHGSAPRANRFSQFVGVRNDMSANSSALHRACLMTIPLRGLTLLTDPSFRCAKTEDLSPDVWAVSSA
eukprot:14317864-Alexandrium_andersonii.AAC.1